jgi:hypothetical protein
MNGCSQSISDKPVLRPLVEVSGSKPLEHREGAAGESTWREEYEVLHKLNLTATLIQRTTTEAPQRP